MQIEKLAANFLEAQVFIAAMEDLELEVTLRFFGNWQDRKGDTWFPGGATFGSGEVGFTKDYRSREFMVVQLDGELEKIVFGSKSKLFVIGENDSVS